MLYGNQEWYETQASVLKVKQGLQAACKKVYRPLVSDLGAGFGDEQHGHGNQWQADEVDPHPTYGFHGLPCKQAGDGGGGEHQKVVHALYFAFFLRSVSEAHELGGTNKGEIPTYAEQYQGGEKVHIALPEQIDDGADDEQGAAEHDDGL